MKYVWWLWKNLLCKSSLISKHLDLLIGQPCGTLRATNVMPHFTRVVIGDAVFETSQTSCIRMPTCISDWWYWVIFWLPLFHANGARNESPHSSLSSINGCYWGRGRITGTAISALMWKISYTHSDVEASTVTVTMRRLWGCNCLVAASSISREGRGGGDGIRITLRRGCEISIDGLADSRSISSIGSEVLKSVSSKSIL